LTDRKRESDADAEDDVAMMIARVPATAERGPAGPTANLPRVQTSNAQQQGSPDAAAFLRDAELASERLSAVVRAVIFASLLALVMTTKVDHHHEHFALFTVAAYGVVAVAALVLAWRRIFHPALPYAYVTFDVLLVCLSVLLTTRMLDLPPHMAFTVPASALIFVVLGHAAMRFRPKLVAYAGMLTGVLMAIGIALMPGRAALVPFSLELDHVDLLQSLLHSRILPFAIIALMTLTLWATSRRTFEILQTSMDHSRRLTMLSRFFTPQLADRLARANTRDLPVGSRRRCAIMFIDIRGFTELAQTMAPEALGRFLTEFRSVVTGAVFKHGGMVDKFIGDAVLAVFGALEPQPDDARRAIVCGLEVLNAVEAWSAESGVGRPPVRIGIGAHYGEVFVGAVGDENMLEFTVVGDAVNLAERLERVTRTVDGDFAVSQDILEASGSTVPIAAWTPISRQFLCGRLATIEAFLSRSGGLADPSLGSERG
jgi:adenylate cyclase